ncbi:hypothetical protein L1887_58078 [Cichorium endivia]|nr:hypothetical protein L1887_58078 [Cichorium endivia]
MPRARAAWFAVTENQVGRFSGSVPDDAKKSPPPNRYSSQLNDASAAPGGPGGPGGPISKRDSEEERPAPALKGFAKRDFGGLHLQRRPHAAVLRAPCLFARAPHDSSIHHAMLSSLCPP